MENWTTVPDPAPIPLRKAPEMFRPQLVEVRVLGTSSSQVH